MKFVKGESLQAKYRWRLELPLTDLEVTKPEAERLLSFNVKKKQQVKDSSISKYSLWSPGFDFKVLTVWLNGRTFAHIWLQGQSFWFLFGIVLLIEPCRVFADWALHCLDPPSFESQRGLFFYEIYLEVPQQGLKFDVGSTNADEMPS